MIYQNKNLIIYRRFLFDRLYLQNVYILGKHSKKFERNFFFKISLDIFIILYYNNIKFTKERLVKNYARNTKNDEKYFNRKGM